MVTKLFTVFKWFGQRKLFYHSKHSYLNHMVPLLTRDLILQEYETLLTLWIFVLVVFFV